MPLSHKEVDWFNHRIRGLEIKLDSLATLLNPRQYELLRYKIKAHEAKWAYDSEGNKKGE